MQSGSHPHACEQGIGRGLPCAFPLPTLISLQAYEIGTQNQACRLWLGTKAEGGVAFKNRNLLFAILSKEIEYWLSQAATNSGWNRFTVSRLGHITYIYIYIYVYIYIYIIETKTTGHPIPGVGVLLKGNPTQAKRRTVSLAEKIRSDKIRLSYI